PADRPPAHRAARSPPGASLHPRRRILTRVMIIAKRLRGKAIATWLGPTGDAARRAVQRAKERLTSAPRRLELDFDIGDPWGYLAGQAGTHLCAAYPVELAIHVVTPPAADVDPAPTLRAAHAVRDAQQLAA